MLQRKRQRQKHSEECKSCCSIWIKEECNRGKRKVNQTCSHSECNKESIQESYLQSKQQESDFCIQKRGCQRKESWNSNGKSNFRKNKKKTASIKIKVVSGAVKKVKLNKSNLALNVGDLGKIKCESNSFKKAYKTLKWTTSNKKVATVTSKGVVKGIGKGTAKITAASLDGTGKKSTCTVTVREKQVVNGIKSLEVYNPLKSYSSSTLKVTLDSPQALTADDFKVETKSYGEGSYMRTVSVDDIYTTDNQTYEVYLANDDIYNGRYVRVTVNALNGQKTAEVQDFW